MTKGKSRDQWLPLIAIPLMFVVVVLFVVKIVDVFSR